MQVDIRHEFGYDFALLGMSRSYYDEADDEQIWWETQQAKAEKRAKLLCVKTPEHSKFLRVIDIKLTIRATRAFWQEYATYKIGSTELSASTMHKLDKREPTYNDFSITTPKIVVDIFKVIWLKYKNGDMSFMELKDSLPEGYLQTRDVSINYATLRNIISQRKDHRYLYWRDMISQIMQQIEHPELLEDLLQ
jgi:hypothetical protein